MSPRISVLRGIVLAAWMSPFLTVAHAGSELILRSARNTTANDGTRHRDLERRATQMFERDIRYTCPETNDEIVVLISGQRPEFALTPDQELHARLETGIVVLVGTENPPPLSADAWNQLAEGGMRVHGFIDLRLFSDAVAAHLQGSLVNLPQAKSSAQSVELTAQGNKLQTILKLTTGSKSPSVFVIRGTPRFVSKNGALGMVLRDAEVTFDGKPVKALQKTMQDELLWRLDGDLAIAATKVEDFFVSQAGPDARAQVNPHPDLRVAVEGNLLHFSLSLDVTLTYTDKP
jgi:hypothetical protein